MRQIKDVKLGDHLCLAFSHETEQQAVASTFVSAGLERRERVLYFTDGTPPEGVERWLGDAGVDTRAAVESGHLRIKSARETYLAKGSFDPDAMIGTLRREVDASLTEGYSGLRVSGEMGWALHGWPGANRLEDYERRVTALFAEGMAAAVCQYDTRRFPSDRLATLSGYHPGSVHMNAVFHEGPLRIIPGFDPDGGLLRLHGTVDHTNSAALRSALDRAAADRAGDVRLDLAELEFIDVAGLRELTRVAAGLPEDRRLHLLNLNPTLDGVIRLIGWDRTRGLVLSAEVALA